MEESGDIDLSREFIRNEFQKRLSFRGPVQSGDCYLMVFSSKTLTKPVIFRESLLASQNLYFNPTDLIPHYENMKLCLIQPGLIPILIAFQDGTETQTIEVKMCSIFTLESLQKD
jgi:hypothetical protein